MSARLALKIVSLPQVPPRLSSHGIAPPPKRPQPTGHAGRRKPDAGRGLLQFKPVNLRRRFPASK